MTYCVIAILLAVAVVLLAIVISRKKAKAKAKKMTAEVEKSLPDCAEALAEISSYYNYGHYITESERVYLNDKYKDLFRQANRLVKYYGTDGLDNKEEIKRFHKAMSDTEGYKKTNNEHFVKNQLDRNKEYFDTVLTYPLDPQQREAIVSLEDNVLVISSAGSGKTMTTVGKVRYLIDKQGVDPKKILLITFTRKAAESLSQRLGERKLKCVTFHKLAIDLIADANGKKPALSSPDFSVQVYHSLMENDKKFKQAVSDFILRSRYKAKSCFEYDSMQEYMMARKKYGVQAYYTDMDGRPVFCKSDEESQICDYLGSRGISFRYEEKYEAQTVDKDHRQYTPDFSIYFKDADGNMHRVYLEHFALNESGHCPKWFTPEEERDYYNSVNWKRSVHAQNGTILLETTSGDFYSGEVFEKLAQQLMRCGVTLSSETPNNASHELVKQEQNILDMLTSFNFLMKSKDMTIEDLMSRRIDKVDKATIDTIVAPFVKAYRALQESRGEIDFTDAIVEATRLCNNGHRPDYDYILVDEFQDISLDRYRFLQSLRRQAPLTKLFCVGDDWQSIYRFAGSDMALFKDFSKYFGYTKECRMETTYRFGEPIIEKSSDFILNNPEQKKKRVRSFNPETSTEIDFIPTTRDTIADQVCKIIDGIPADKEVYLLGRYSFDVKVMDTLSTDIIDKNGCSVVKYNGREITFMTVHQSKGLESDYVILLNCNSGTLGFPADITDYPILKYVLSEPDGYKFGEERRVFYVGITRAKKHTYVLFDQKKPSPFVSEFIEVDTPKQPEIPEDEICPKCHCGRIRRVYSGVAVNGNPYFVLACSNQIFGCDYQEKQFVNLNRHRGYR